MSWQAKQASPPAWSPACCATLAAGVAFPERAVDSLPRGSAVPSNAALAANASKNSPIVAAFHPLFECGMVSLLDSADRTALSLPKGRLCGAVIINARVSLGQENSDIDFRIDVRRQRRGSYATSESA